jgi:gamma-glutamyltranspeptidase / glutathione hydrolase
MLRGRHAPRRPIESLHSQQSMKQLQWNSALRTVVATALALAGAAQIHAASQAPVAAENGMVVTAQHLATDVGVRVLKRGGNAVDAAAAVGYALAVVYPAAGNLGGGGFMTAQMGDGRRFFLDFREKAPPAATADMYLDKDGRVIEGFSRRGHLAVAVPGTVSGLEWAREKYGTMKRGPLIAPAIASAERGFVLDQGDVDVLSQATADFRQDPSSAAIFLNAGEPYVVAQKLVQKDLAKALRAVSRNGVDGFYKGPVANAIAASNQSGKGLITQTDLEQYKTRGLPPVECDYRGYRVLSAPPPSSGGTAICEMLNILEGYPLADLGFHSAQGVHYQIEAMRYAYIDRDKYLGDPDFVSNPVDRLVDKGYAARIRVAIDPKKAGVSAPIQPGVAPREGTNTTHYSVIDQWGNAVSVTYSLNDWFGARVTATGTGVLLNDVMDDFSSKPGAPNLYGLVQGEANSIAPGKRTSRKPPTPRVFTNNGCRT